MLGHGFITIGIFTVEEMEYINNFAAGQTEELTKDFLIKALSFNNTVSGEEQDVKDFCTGLQSKIENLTDEEWDDIKNKIPFQISYSDEDVPPSDNENVDEL